MPALILVIVAELGVLFGWTFGEDPKGHEIVVDQIQWTSRYTCTTNNNAGDLIQYLYLFVLCMIAPVVINRYWKKQTMPDDNRILFFCSYSVLLLLAVVMILDNTNSTTDDQKYTTHVLLYLIIVGVVIGAWSTPVIYKMLKGWKGSSDDNTHVTMAHSTTTTTARNNTIDG
jgi:hypothetical protein